MLYVGYTDQTFALTGHLTMTIRKSLPTFGARRVAVVTSRRRSHGNSSLNLSRRPAMPPRSRVEKRWNDRGEWQWCAIVDGNAFSLWPRA